MVGPSKRPTLAYIVKLQCNPTPPRDQNLNFRLADDPETIGDQTLQPPRLSAVRRPPVPLPSSCY